MDKAEARQLLDEKLSEYRGLTYDQLIERMNSEDHYEVVGFAGAEYQVEIQFFWDGPPGGDLRVLGSIDDGSFWYATKPLTDDFVIAPDGRFVGE